MDAKYERIQNNSFLLTGFLAVVSALIFSQVLFAGRNEVLDLQLQTRINPNIAPVESLERLPQIGLTRAERIAAYRQSHGENGPVFIYTNDLQKVRGIGPVIAGQLSEHLRFE
jgi:DNA uptake protein ComE-like DNA-binding protein